MANSAVATRAPDPEPNTPDATTHLSERDSGELVHSVFQHDNPNAFWSQVVAEIGDLLKSHAKSASHVAILGPNKLEISFSHRYQFSRKYCETPESIRRLEEIASRLAKVPLRIQVTSHEDETEVSAPKEPARETRFSRRVYKPEEDQFVSQVMVLFEAQVVKIEPVLVGQTVADG